MNKPIVNGSIVIAAALCLSGVAQAQSLQVQRPVPYAEDNDIADNIKNECKINEELVDSLKAHAGGGVEFSSGPVDTGSGRALQLEIMDAVSMGNAWLGHQKYMKV